VGKTAFAIQLAQHFQTQIISADSRQCFNELNIGVAKPSTQELHSIHHYFINSHSIHEEVNAVVFEQYALKAAEAILTNNDVAIMVGGTGLYIKAFCDGLDDIPPIDTAVRKQVFDLYETGGLQALQLAVENRDPQFWQTAEQQNPQRLMRALEILISTNEPIAAFRKGEKKQRDFNIIKIGLELPREQLYQQVNNRVDQMIQAGLLQEVESLLPYKHLNALQTVGYREFFPVFESQEPLEAAIKKLKINTRHYAKRQLTWFKKDPAFHWAHAHHPQLLSSVMAQLNS
jgi:tRNA dimethylallyltransferase